MTTTTTTTMYVPIAYRRLAFDLAIRTQPGSMTEEVATTIAHVNVTSDAASLTSAVEVAVTGEYP
jgi:hypothetical protein